MFSNGILGLRGLGESYCLDPCGCSLGIDHVYNLMVSHETTGEVS